MNWKATLAGAATAVLVSLGAASSAEARHDNCFRKVRSEQIKLQREIARHGFFSRQARNRQIKINWLERQCSRDFLRDRRDHRWRDGRRFDRDDRYDRRYDRRYVRPRVLIIPRW